MDAEGGHRRPRGRVVVVGSINLDVVLSMPRLPRAGETVTGGTYARHHGGKGANQAVAAARAGGDVYLVGAVGDGGGPGAGDARDALGALAAEGVDVSAVATLHGPHTGHAAVIVDAAGENQIAVAPGANAAVTAGHVRGGLGALAITRHDVIVLSFELMDAPLLAAAAAARQAGAALVVNPAPARQCDQGLLRGAILTPNRHELMTLYHPGGRPPGTPRRPGADSGRSDAGEDADGAGAGHGDVATAALVLSRRTGGPVIATLGREGALLADGAAAEHFPGHPVTARDTTGAGDTLTGVLAAGLADSPADSPESSPAGSPAGGRDLRVALRRAVAAAALAVTRVGAREGMPRASEIDALLATGR